MNLRLSLRRLFVAFVCLSVLFSSTFSAYANIDEDFIIDDSVSVMSLDSEDTTTGAFTVYYHGSYGNYSNNRYEELSTYFWHNYSSDSIDGSRTATIRASTDEVNPMTSYAFVDQFLVLANGNTKIASKGESITMSIDGIKQSAIAYNASGEMKRYALHNGQVIKSHALIADIDGNYDEVEGKVTLEVNDGLITIGAEFDSVPFDVYKINAYYLYDPAISFNNNDGDTSLTATGWGYTKILRGVAYNNSLLTIKVDDNTSALLSAIIGFIKSILDGVTKIFDKLGDFMSSVGNWFGNLISKIGDFISSVGNWFGVLFQHIIDLPGIMWDWIENGLKALFVPDEEYISDYKDRWDNCLSDRFGAIYQSVTLVTDYVETLQQSSTKSTITMPSTTIELPDGNEFTFGGFSVRVVPQGFDFLADVVKLAVDIICTFLFVNALKRRFDNILGDRL